MSFAILSFLFLILFEFHYFFQFSEGLPTEDKNEDIQFKLSIPYSSHVLKQHFIGIVWIMKDL